MNFYEFTYLIDPELSKTEITSLQDKIKSLIQEEGGTVKSTGHPSKRILAYPIKKKREAFLADLSFVLEPEKLKNIKKKLKAEKQILRFLLLKKQPPKEPKVARKPRIKTKTKVELKEIEKKLEEILGAD